ncbi:hypothetical protein GWK41_06250 [Persephonella atlantica]|uniref:Uncharacterized protein n=1 Tax=Persephonella atlantica TaxID=2699429 RepID=A0ABS1GIB3_9AQUI|nr:hypothetical protein [Persephonella atlantica]MBK3332664.1 hypothetical protein [Persephonella atlantica]
MKKITVGNIRFTKPVIEKLVDIYYVVENEGKDILKHRYFILSYDEFDTSYEKLVEKLGEKDIKLLVIDETVSVDFGDEELQKHMDTKILYDEEWIIKHNPDRENFEQWLVEFVDRLILTEKGKC